MPRIGFGHAGYPKGIFSLMQDPGGTVHTPGSGTSVRCFQNRANGRKLST